MSADLRSIDHARRRRVMAATVTVGLMLVAGIFFMVREEAAPTGPTVEEQITDLRSERASLEARADGEARIGLLTAFRTASLLTDALAVRLEADGDRGFDRLPSFRRQAFAELEALNAALKEALDRPGAGARLAASKAAGHAAAQLDRLAGDDAPLVLSFTPRFVPPRHATGELTLPPAAAARPDPRAEGGLRLDAPGQPAAPATSAGPAVPRYAPDFTAAGDEDPPVQIEIVGSHLAIAGGLPPVLSIGKWRGPAVVAPGRLRFAVPRSAFATDTRRTTFLAGTLAIRRGARSVPFQLLFTVLPDRPGAFALDQRVNTTSLESNTLVSPEILSRAPAGETRTVRRCFDPPAGWRFDRDRLRVVIVERLGWQEDVSDPTLNSGSVEFVPSEEPAQVCIAVIARPVMRSARTATIGRFEATLLRDRPSETAVKSGVRALDWREAARVLLEPGMVEWKLYVRLFDDIDREFGGQADAGLPRATMPFLRIETDDSGRTVILRADPTAEP
ncbi:MAG: hypothetical protein ISP49_12530 [Reyranella sp.]|nr:hypothetical protein [Reyranella sp.]MBL6652416.1 hypothetical protein [Reyranella sp.]